MMILKNIWTVFVTIYRIFIKERERTQHFMRKFSICMALSMAPLAILALVILNTGVIHPFIVLIGFTVLVVFTGWLWLTILRR